MRKVKCPVCEKTKRPYGLPRSDIPRAIQPHQMEYKIGTYEMKCDACGTTLFVQMDYVLELAPVDIKEVWTADGVPGEVVDEKRGTKRKPVSELVEVDPSTITRPVKEPKRSKPGK